VEEKKIRKVTHGKLFSHVNDNIMGVRRGIAEKEGVGVKLTCINPKMWNNCSDRIITSQPEISLTQHTIDNHFFLESAVSIQIKVNFFL
jgi:hypothetical protein